MSLITITTQNLLAHKLHYAHKFNIKLWVQCSVDCGLLEEQMSLIFSKIPKCTEIKYDPECVRFDRFDQSVYF